MCCCGLHKTLGRANEAPPALSRKGPALSGAGADETDAILTIPARALLGRDDEESGALFAPGKLSAACSVLALGRRSHRFSVAWAQTGSTRQTRAHCRVRKSRLGLRRLPFGGVDASITGRWLKNSALAAEAERWRAAIFNLYLARARRPGFDRGARFGEAAMRIRFWFLLRCGARARAPGKGRSCSSTPAGIWQ
jgi:hypothetical protein